RRGATTAMVGIFAIHPTRCESVVWIAGVHDVLCALWQLLALCCAMSAWNRTPRQGMHIPMIKWAAALVLYAMAIATKEIAIFFPAILALVRWTDPRLAGIPPALRLRAALIPAAPFVLIAGAFLVARHAVLGRTQIDYAFKPGWGTVATTLPVVFVTYLRQIVFPYWIGWSYPVRAVTAGHTGFANFLLPLMIVAILVALAARLRWDRIPLIGLAIFVLTLLPAMNIRAFPPDNLVKDRYLYLPLLGFLMIAMPTIEAALRRLGPAVASRGGATLASCAIGLLATRTVLYNRAWMSEVAMWEWSLWTDPTSASNHLQLGVALLDSKQYAPARQQINEGLTLERLPLLYLALCDVNIAEGRFADATTAAQQALELAPTDYRMYERLAKSYEKRGMLSQAEATLRTAITKIPYRRAYFSDQLAVILYQQGRRAEAQAELESARAAAREEYAVTSRLVSFHLAMLYREQGRDADSRDALSEFLRL